MPLQLAGWQALEVGSVVVIQLMTDHFAVAGEAIEIITNLSGFVGLLAQCRPARYPARSSGPRGDSSAHNFSLAPRGRECRHRSGGSA